jgi:GH25 family lysozyme M1 (1,4-beta-N-acetylmuramidase)
MILGVDYSHWQSLISADKLKSKAVKFAIVKAGEIYLKAYNKPAMIDDMHDRNISEQGRPSRRGIMLRSI